jgi:hypothetical protein
MHYTRISTSTKKSFTLDIQCEACNRLYQVRGSYNAYSQVEARGYVTKVDGATRQFLADGVNKSISATDQALLNGEIGNLGMPILFEPSLEGWRCPDCGYAQSWMLKGFHYGRMVMFLAAAGCGALGITSAVVLGTMKGSEGLLCAIVGISFAPILPLVFIDQFAPWLIKHPNQKWFREHNRTRKDAPAGRKPVKITTM